MATKTEHRERVGGAGGRWLEAARAYVTAWREPLPDGVPSVRQQQTSEGERMARTGYERALADYRRHRRGESHDESRPGAALDTLAAYAPAGRSGPCDRPPDRGWLGSHAEYEGVPDRDE